MIDTHCHFNFKEFGDKRRLLDATIISGVSRIINPSSSLVDSLESYNLSKEFENIYFTPGIHPESLLDLPNINLIEEHINDKKCVGIGEIGLDYHYFTNSQIHKFTNSQIEEIKKKQEELFIGQLEIAKKYNKAVIIHNRDSKDDLYDILKQYNLNGVIHCFSEDKEFAKKVLDLGFYISFTANITFKNVKDYMIEAIKYIPKDRLLCETDGPFLAPQEFRGKLNIPEYVKYVYLKICEIKNLDFKEFESQVDLNAKELFGI